MCPTGHSIALICRKLQFTSLLGLSQTRFCRAEDVLESLALAGELEDR